MSCWNLSAAGAAWFGQDTEDNILQNDLGKKEVQAFLNISIARALPPGSAQHHIYSITVHAGKRQSATASFLAHKETHVCCWVHSVSGHQPAAGRVPSAAGA
jgi:hypothetical protein